MQCFSPYDSSVIEEEGLFFLAFSSLNILFSGRTIRVFFAVVLLSSHNLWELYVCTLTRVDCLRVGAWKKGRGVGAPESYSWTIFRRSELIQPV